MPGVYAFNKAVYGATRPVNPFGVTFYVSNATNPTEDQGSTGPLGGTQGRSPKAPFTSIATAAAQMVSGRGDVMIIQRGTYTENVNFNADGAHIMSAMTDGYPDHVNITGRCTVGGNGVVFEGIEFFSNSATLASMTVGSTSAEVNGVTFRRCSFASDGTTNPRAGLRLLGGNNHAVLGCRFVNNTLALLLHSGASSFVSGCRIEDNEFLENVTVDVGTDQMSGTDAFGYAQGARSVVIARNIFGGGETLPTRFINIVGTSSGLIAQNHFARATNAASVIVIPAGILYGPNGTEAGWSTARPA